MRRAFGPIFTTGVALSAAAVVVANPVIPPRSDVQIPAIQLSAGAGDALGMLDEDFLKAIAPAPPESTNPFVIIRDLITSLAADATYLGKSAIVDAFVAGATAVTQPELTAASFPYLPDAPSNPYQAAVVPPLPAALTPLSTEAVLPADLDLAAAGVAELTPVVAQVVTAVVDDVNYVGNQLVTAAFAAGALLATEPVLIVNTLVSLIRGDVRGALEGAVAAVAAPFGPPGMIIEAIHTVIARRLPYPQTVHPPVTDPPVAPEISAPAPAPIRVVTSPTDQDSPRRSKAVIDIPVDEPRPAAGVAAATVRELDAGARASGLGDGDDVENKATPGDRAGSGPVGRAVTAVADQAKTVLRNVGDAVRQAAGRQATAVDGPGGE